MNAVFFDMPEETRGRRLARLIEDSAGGRTIPPLTRPRLRRGPSLCIRGERVSSRTTRIPFYLAIVGGVSAGVALLLPWYDVLGESASAFEVYERADVYLLVFAIAGAVIALANVGRPRASFPVAMGLVGGLALGPPLMLRLEAGFGKDANEAIAVGWYVYLAGAGLMCAAAVLAQSRAAR